MKNILKGRGGALCRVLALWAALAPQVARGEDRAKARNLFVEAMKRYNLGEYQKALDGFKQAYIEFPEPLLLFNIGQAWRQLGQKKEAAGFYRSYLRELPNAPNANEVRSLVLRLDAEIISDQAHEPPETMMKPPVAPIIIVPSSPQPTEQRTGANPAPWAVFGVGGGLALVGGGLLGGSAADLSQARAATTLPQQHERQNVAQQLEVGGWVVLGIGAVAIITGTILLAVRHSSPARSYAVVR